MRTRCFRLLLEPQPPAPVAFGWSPDLRTLTVTFDEPLVDQPLATSNWTVAPAFPGMEHPVAAGVDLPVSVELTFGFPVGSSATTLEYAATPPDLFGADGLAVTPFVLDLG